MSLSNLPSAASQGSEAQSLSSDNDGAGDFVIVLAFQADGSIQVSSQSSDQGSDADQDVGNDGSDGGEDGEQGQTVDNLDDAFDLVEQLAEQQGYHDSGSGDDGDSDVGDRDASDAQAAQGSRDGGDRQLEPAAARALWNRLARSKDKARAEGA